MNIRYSPSTGSFYPYNIEYKDLPDDLIDVPIKDFERAMNRPLGSSFDFVNGELRIIPFVETAEQRQNVARARLSEMQSLASNQVSILTDATDPDIVDEPTPEDTALLVQWKKYRQALRTVDISADTINWPAQPGLASGVLSTNESE